jgi:hypothetical protein
MRVLPHAFVLHTNTNRVFFATDLSTVDLNVLEKCRRGGAPVEQMLLPGLRNMSRLIRAPLSDGAPQVPYLALRQRL